MITIWQIGNTGVRNPMRIQAALRVYVESSLVGEIRSVEGTSNFMRLMHEKGILLNQSGRDGTGSYGRKFRLEFNKNGFTFDKVKSPLLQRDFGAVDTLTPFGRTFLNADTVPAMQECFLRANSVPMEELPNDRSFSPLRWTLSVLLELERRGLEPALGFAEFAAFVQTSDPTHGVVAVVDKILSFRGQRLQSTAKKRFDAQQYEVLGRGYAGKVENFREYGDMNLRYLRATGMVRSKGHGIVLMVEKRSLAEKLSAVQIFDESLSERYHQLYEGPRLPTDDMEVALGVLGEMESLVRRNGLVCSIDRALLTTVADVNAARHRLENLLSQQAEEAYAKDQKNHWREIAAYMDLVMHGGGTKRYADETEIKVSHEEVSAYLEWCLWRAFLAINTLCNKPYQLRRFKIDQDFFPVSTAPGNGPDLVVEYEHDVIAIEVTLSCGSRQEAMEGEPVRRHVADLVQKYPMKDVHGLFVANRVDTNTAETFRHGVWYGQNDAKMSLDIVPFTLGQFKGYFSAMFESGRHSGSEIMRLLARCGGGRDQIDAPTWKQMIASDVDAEILSKRTVVATENSYGALHESFLAAAGVRAATPDDGYDLPHEIAEVAE